MKMRILLCFVWFTTIFIHAQNTAVPDPNFEQRLIDMGYDSGVPDGVVPTSNIIGVVQLWVPNSSITDLTGIEDFAALEILDITGNGISALNVSNNTALRELYMETNPVSVLDVSLNGSLEILRCGYMLLTSLDVSNNTALTQLHCQSNSLIDLNVKNGNNVSLTTFTAINNDPSLCIEVDNAIDANNGLGVYAAWATDAGISFSEDCDACPEMNVVGNAMTIVSGDNTPDVLDDTHFGTVNFGNYAEHTFTIENSGSGPLDLTGTPLISISGSVDFTVTNPPDNIVPSLIGTTTFTIRYEPSMAGTINTATLSIANNDCDENPYTFDVRGQSSTLGLTEVGNSKWFNLYPNPNNGEFFMELNESGQFKIIIYNITGQRLKTYSLFPGQHIQKINLRDYKGICFLEVLHEQEKVVKKLVIY